LVTTENFEEVECNFYKGIKGEILLTREQIGSALRYADPQKAIDNIHSRHQNRLDELSTIHKVRGKTGQEYNTTFYTQRGIMEICRWSRQPKANEFMDWCWDIIEKYRNGELNSNNNTIITALSSLTEVVATLTSSVAAMQQDITEVKQSQRNRFLSDTKYPSAWYKKMKPKYELLMDYFDCSRKELYSSIYKELEDTYDIDLNQICEDYCYDNHLLKDECYPMDAIEHDQQLRDATTLLIDTTLVKYGLQTEDQIKNFKRTTLFDTPVAEVS